MEVSGHTIVAELRVELDRIAAAFRRTVFDLLWHDRGGLDEPVRVLDGWMS